MKTDKGLPHFALRARAGAANQAGDRNGIPRPSNKISLAGKAEARPGGIAWPPRAQYQLG